MAFYQVDLRKTDSVGTEKSDTNSTTNELTDDSSFQVSLHSGPSSLYDKSAPNSILSPSNSDKHESIQSFLQEIGRSSTAFSESPSKNNRVCFTALL